MKFINRHSAVVVAALFATAPLAISHQAKAADTGAESVQATNQQTAPGSTQTDTSNNQQNGNKTTPTAADLNQDPNSNENPKKDNQPTTPTSTPSKSSQPGDSIDNPIKILSTHYDDPQLSKPIKIKLTQNLNEDDISEWLMRQKGYYYINNQHVEVIDKYTKEGLIANKELQEEWNKSGHAEVSRLIGIGGASSLSADGYGDGYTFQGFAGFTGANGELNSNTWYQWRTQQNPYSDFPTDKNETPNVATSPLKDVLKIELLSNKIYRITAKTDASGELPHIDIKGKFGYHTVIYYPVISITLSSNEGITIPHYEKNKFSGSTSADSDVDNPTNTTDDSSSQASSDSSLGTITQDTQASSADTETPAPSTTSNTATSTPSTSQSTTNPATTTKQDTTSSKKAPTSTAKKQTTSAPLMLDHNAYVYDKNGNATKNKKGQYYMLPRYKNISALNNGKVVTIKGKKFYQIGKNKFVKVVNTTKRPVAKSFVSNAKVKVVKAKKVRLYSENGKYTKKYLSSNKSIKLSKVKTIKGKKYYQIKGTNYWIRANKVTLKK